MDRVTEFDPRLDPRSHELDAAVPDVVMAYLLLTGHRLYVGKSFVDVIDPVTENYLFDAGYAISHATALERIVRWIEAGATEGQRWNLHF